HEAKESDRFTEQLARHHSFDVVVADAEGARREIADHADGDAADCRPPHPMNRQMLEEIFDPVDGARDVDRQPSDHRAVACVRRERFARMSYYELHTEYGRR